MKTKFITLPIFFILLYTSIFSQENVENTIIKPLQKNTLYREKVFLHLNKSVYFTNETVWIVAYVGEDAKNKPSIYTSNLQLNLIDFNGNLVQQKTIFIKNGVGKGDFLLDNNLPPGNYFIQGLTNYMQNFGKQNVFVQEIKIINPTLKKELKQESYTNHYDIQLFPESGYLLEGVESTIGIKALINGKGFPFTGKIITSEGVNISNFTGNMLGMGKCKFNYAKNETYTAVIKINDTIQKIKLPKANKTGVIFSVDNSDEEKLILTLKTNEQTLPSLQNSNLALLFYRNNYISTAVTLSLINNEETTQELVFDKNKMLNGVNIVTLFKDNQPIAERKFFVNKPSEQTAILIDELNTKNDSIRFKIKTLNSKLKPVKTQLSISVLPKTAENFSENQSIKSAFLLTPYVKGTIENPSYYFKNSSQKKKEYLDLLLLNQGWSTYSLKEKIKEINPPEKFEFESGFTIKGKIKWHPKGYNIGIISKKGDLIATSEINKNKQFSFKNVFNYKNDSIKITLFKNKSPLVKPNKISFIADTVKTFNNDFITNKYNQSPIKKYSSDENLNLENFKIYPNIEVLNQIVLKTVKLKRKRNFYDDEMNLASKRNEIAAGFYDNHKVTERMETTFHTVFDYFTSLGYIKRTNWGRYFISIRNTPVTFAGENRNPDNTYPPHVFLNNISLTNSGDIEMLKELIMTDIDEILINKSGAGGGINGAGGIIKIYSKRGNHKYYKYGKTLYKGLISLTGFDRANNYFKPQYNIYTKEAFNWSEIDWKNNLQTNKKGEVFIKTPTNKFSSEYQFIINGFSEDGLLFNTVYKTSKENTF
jgi:hypothetical protein